MSPLTIIDILILKVPAAKTSIDFISSETSYLERIAFLGLPSYLCSYLNVHCLKINPQKPFIFQFHQLNTLIVFPLKLTDHSYN